MHSVLTLLPLTPSATKRALAAILGQGSLTLFGATLARIALRAGVPLKVVSEQLGHTSVRTTGDLYTEVLGDL